RHTRFSRDWSSDVCSSDLDLDGAVDLAARIVGTVERVRREIQASAGRALMSEQKSATTAAELEAMIAELGAAWAAADGPESDEQIGRASGRERGMTEGVEP